MLFLYFIAALNDATGWMLGLAVFGMVFSDRPARYFILPALAAVGEDPNAGVLIVVFTWLYLFWKSTNAAADRARERQKNEALIEQAHRTAENAMHQSAKPGA